VKSKKAAKKEKAVDAEAAEGEAEKSAEEELDQVDV
jgi:hypothetical protein